MNLIQFLAMKLHQGPVFIEMLQNYDRGASKHVYDVVQQKLLTHEAL